MACEFRTKRKPLGRRQVWFEDSESLRVKGRELASALGLAGVALWSAVSPLRKAFLDQSSAGYLRYIFRQTACDVIDMAGRPVERPSSQHCLIISVVFSRKCRNCPLFVLANPRGNNEKSHRPTLARSGALCEEGDETDETCDRSCWLMLSPRFS